LQFARAMAESREACKNITFSLHYLLVPANAVPTSFCFLYRVIRSQVFFKSRVSHRIPCWRFLRNYSILEECLIMV
jgi:uncharacterized membrane protein